MNAAWPERKSLASGTVVVLLLALVKLLLHFYTNLFAGYGIFRDELYYIACSKHLSAGYVDQPPLSIFILAVNRLLFGDSIFALRLLPAIAGAITVYLTGLMARELGGGKTAQVLACLASIASPIFLGIDTVYSMNAFDVLIWALTAWLVIRLIKTGDGRYWPILGIVLGLGLLNKVGVLWLDFGIFLGLLLAPQRAWLKTKGPYVAGVLAFLVFLPFIVWNLTHNLAHLEFIRNATSQKYSSLSALTFTSGQIIQHGPVKLPLWLGGLLAILFIKQLQDFRILGYVYIAAFLILALNGQSKAEYLSPAYSMLFAAGGVIFERWFSRRFQWATTAYAALMILGGILLAPLALPILPVETYIRYADALHIAPNTAEGKQLDKLPQFYADMFGWEQKAEAVARIYHSLTPEEQSTCALFADNYGRCAAIDFYGNKYHLPPAIGRHNNYWIWGPGNYTGELMIILGGGLRDKQEKFESVVVADTIHCDYCMPYENNLCIYVCRNLKMPLQTIWPQLKAYQ